MEKLLEAFERYRDLIDDWDAFVDALQRPLPVSFWINTNKIPEQAFVDILQEERLKPTALPWYPNGYTLPSDSKLGGRWHYLLGFSHIQEAVSLLPVMFLEPKPGERILDMCAAPGGKTAQIAMRMEGKGTLVANDANKGRLKAVRRHLSRLGLQNLAITKYDASNYPNAAGQFDRILADVPCSCQGTSRKKVKVASRSLEMEFLQKIRRTQIAILKRAVKLCRPGGRIVYSTCTYAPEENESVVNEILQSFGPEQVRVLPMDIEGFRMEEGITSWEGESFDDSLRHTRRVWPHHNDTGGFYVAVLEKSAEIEEPKKKHQKPVSFGLDEDVYEPIPMTYPHLQELVQHFGIPEETFEGLHFVKRGCRKMYLFPEEHLPPRRPEVMTVGLPFMSVGKRLAKLNTSAALVFGRYATQNVVDLEKAQLDAFIRLEPIPIDAHQARHCTELGYVLLRYRSYIVGITVFLPERKAGELVDEAELDREDKRRDPTLGGILQAGFPKAWALEYTISILD